MQKAELSLRQKCLLLISKIPDPENSRASRPRKEPVKRPLCGDLGYLGQGLGGTPLPLQELIVACAYQRDHTGAIVSKPPLHKNRWAEIVCFPRQGGSHSFGTACCRSSGSWPWAWASPRTPSSQWPTEVRHPHAHLIPSSSFVAPENSFPAPGAFLQPSEICRVTVSLPSLRRRQPGALDLLQVTQWAPGRAQTRTNSGFTLLPRV